MSTFDANEDYKKAQKAGQREYKNSISAGEDPYLQVLDTILDEVKAPQQIPVGLIEIPVELIVGTKTTGRQFAFSRSFLPLLDVDTEFALKWTKLCQAHLGDEGIQEPIRCFEYYGKFYVQEGNKRVSVLRYFGASAIPGYVTRVLPVNDGSQNYELYQEFLEFNRLTGLYTVRFSQPGAYQKLLVQLGMAGKPWDKEYTKHFSSSFTRFCCSLRGQLFLDKLTPADALLIFLRYHDFNEIRSMAESELRLSIAALQPDVNALAQPNPVAVSTQPAGPVKEGLFDWILPRRPKRLHIAFLHERDAEVSTWTRGHELGRRHLEELFPTQVETRAYLNTVPGQQAEEAIEQAIEDGANVIFTTTPPLMGATLRAAARHPDIWMLNCSVDMPYPDVRTYYGRVYEGKFITGAIAGAMARDGRIGYVGSYPIYGVPASINAFALGAQMVNPDVEIHLEWSCVRQDCMDVFRKAGIHVVSNRDIPTPNQQYVDYGTSILQPDGTTLPLASPVWYWGRLYENIVRSLLDGSWYAEQNAAGKRAVNYWWGMSSGVIDVQLNDTLPVGVATLAKILRRSLQAGQLDPFARRIVAQDGTVKNDGGHTFTADEILHMDWLCDCVKGSIPPFEEILPMAKKMVRLQGVYRDLIPPESEEQI